MSSRNNANLLKLHSVNENSERQSNSIPYMLYFYLSGSVFSVNYSSI